MNVAIQQETFQHCHFVYLDFSTHVHFGSLDFPAFETLMQEHFGILDVLVRGHYFIETYRLWDILVSWMFGHGEIMACCNVPMSTSLGSKDTSAKMSIEMKCLPQNVPCQNARFQNNPKSIVMLLQKTFQSVAHSFLPPLRKRCENSHTILAKSQENKQKKVSQY